MKCRERLGIRGRRGRSPCGERGLKFVYPTTYGVKWRRSPCGERGLKCVQRHNRQCAIMSLPVRGAWIEISAARRISSVRSSLPVRGAWIEIRGRSEAVPAYRSLPVRGAWIEIFFPGMRVLPCCRSPCGERGLKFDFVRRRCKPQRRRSPCGERGLKCNDAPTRDWLAVSLPVRGAWIEITDELHGRWMQHVAPRAGSVD